MTRSDPPSGDRPPIREAASHAAVSVLVVAALVAVRAVDLFRRGSTDTARNERDDGWPGGATGPAPSLPKTRPLR